jgi:hypothetical protein
MEGRFGPGDLRLFSVFELKAQITATNDRLALLKANLHDLEQELYGRLAGVVAGATIMVDGVKYECVGHNSCWPRFSAITKSGTRSKNVRNAYNWKAYQTGQLPRTY